jgi:hypothetical protein
MVPLTASKLTSFGLSIAALTLKNRVVLRHWGPPGQISVLCSVIDKIPRHLERLEGKGGCKIVYGVCAAPEVSWFLAVSVFVLFPLKCLLSTLCS